MNSTRPVTSTDDAMNRLRVFVIFLLIPAVNVGAVTYRALIFGLGQYQDESWGTIHGDNDLYYVQQMLTDAGFTDIVQVKNEQATKQGMVQAFMNLERRCGSGDVVYVHYSGHGQLMTDLDGDEALRTTARHGQWDESWVPYDACMNYCDKDHGEKHFCDDEVEFYLSSIRGKIGRKGKLTVVTDACHSGDSTRSNGEEEECVRGVDVKFNIPRENDEGAPVAREERWLTISACKPYQLCTELKAMNIGKLTFALYSIGREVFTLSAEELQSRLDAYMEMNRGRLPQNPVVSGKR